jgi:hypothetical protein
MAASMHQFGISASGLMSQRLRDLDAGTARPPLPPRALPDDVRRRLKLPDRAADERVLPVISVPKSKAAGRFSSVPEQAPAQYKPKPFNQQKKNSPYLMVNVLIFELFKINR